MKKKHEGKDIRAKVDRYYDLQIHCDKTKIKCIDAQVDFDCWDEPDMSYAEAPRLLNNHTYEIKKKVTVTFLFDNGAPLFLGLCMERVVLWCMVRTYQAKKTWSILV